MSGPIYVQLGATGDIISILPLLHDEAHKSGEAVRLMVAKDYSGLLEGCSYIEPVIFDGPHFAINLACEQASALSNGAGVKCLQVKGPRAEVEQWAWKPAGIDTSGKMTPSFEMEAWRIAGRLNDWPKDLPLVFDRRSKEREEKLFDTISDKPLILLALEGTSSPFEHADLLAELVTGKFGEGAQVMRLPKVERFYDLLALYEVARCLIAIDSAPLHLARAVPKLPVVALTNDKPLLWHGSAWRPQFCFYCRYSDWPKRATEMLRAISYCEHIIPQGDPMIVHVWNNYRLEGQSNPRPPWIETPIEPGACGRDSSNALNDETRFPYLRDALSMALRRARDKDMVCLTRADTALGIKADEALLDHEASFAYRMAIKDGQRTFQPIVDMFCATRGWWKAHMRQIPDCVLGNDCWWSHALWTVFKAAGAADLTGIASRAFKEPAKVQGDPPRIQVNRTFAQEAMQTLKIYSRFPPVHEQVKLEPLDLASLKPYGYNPTIIESEGWTLLAYRFHPDKDHATTIGLAQIDEAGNVLSHRALELDAKSAEDPRFFKWRQDTCMSFVVSSWPVAVRSLVRYVYVLKNLPKDIVTPNIGQNDGGHSEKNWVFFEQGGQLWCIYATSPRQLIYVQDGHFWKQVVDVDAPHWPWGDIRGGCVVPWNGALLRFFHSSQRNEYAGNIRHRYFVGAMALEAKPPFKTLAMSRKPILFGSEMDNLRVKDRPFHWKANVVFPGGAIVVGNQIRLALGVNDAACAIARLHPDQLHL